MKQEILNLTQKLVQIESTKDKPKNLQKVIKLIADYFKDTNLIIKYYKKNNKPSLVILTHETKKPKLFLNGHLDVVEAEQNQYDITIEKDKIQGRGVFDNKGPVAIMMVAMKKLATQNPNFSLGLMLTTDEEIGGFNGVRYLTEDKNYSCDVAFIPDGGTNFDILTDEKGILHLTLTGHGKAAHGAKPWEGKNALDELIKGYNILRQNFPNPKTSEDWKTSLNLGKIEGGQSPNKVPDKAEMLLDFRFPAPETAELLLEKIKNHIETLDIDIKTRISGASLHTDKKNPYLQKYKQIIEKIIGKEIKFIKYPPGSDARFFSAKGIPVIMSRGNGGGQHGKNEWASISDYEKSYEILSQFIQKVC